MHKLLGDPPKEEALVLQLPPTFLGNHSSSLEAKTITEKSPLRNAGRSKDFNRLWMVGWDEEEFHTLIFSIVDEFVFHTCKDILKGN